MPNNYSKPIIFTFLFLSFIALISIGQPVVIAQSSENGASATLFTSSDLALSREATAGLARARTVTVNENHLGGAAGPDFVTGEGRTIHLNLFEDTILTAHLDKLNQNPSGSYTWIGKVAGDPLSSVVLVVRDGTVYGSIQTSFDGEYAIQPLTGGVHAVQEAGITTILPEDDTHIDPDSENLPPTRAVSNDDGSIIDVLVVYSDDVPVANAESYAELFIAYTNQAYENSQITQRVWLVDTEQYTYAETGDLDTDLDNITPGKPNAAPVLNPDVTPHRDETHADLVLFFVNDDGNNANSCSGLAWLQTGLTTSFENRGFSAMKACAFGNNVFAHELGHNMGSRHDWFMDDSTTPASTAHGYVDTTNGFRTIMAYNNRCAAIDSEFVCSRVAHFSNPAVTFGGAPTGVAAGTSTACSDDIDGGLNTGTDGDPNPAVECDADNASNFNAKAAITSQFRDSRLTWTGAVSTDWSNAANWTINEGAPGATTSTARVPRSFDNIYIPGGLGQYPTISGGTAYARELVIDSGASLTMSGGTLHIGWRWEDTGGFDATGGTVQFSGPIGVHIDSTSAFHDIAIGTGSDTTGVILDNNIDIDGDLTIGAGATFSPGAYSVMVGGDWSEGDAAGFTAGTSTVIFDGTAQTVDKVTTVNVLNEMFTDADDKGCGCSSLHIPSGWSRESASGSGWLAGNLTGSGEVIRWNSSTDAWLFTTAHSLDSAVEYALSFKYRNFLSGNPTTYTIYVGTSPNAGAMTTQIHQVAGAASTSEATTSGNFSVGTSGIYYFGIRNQQDSGANYAILDDFVVTGSNGLNFHNLQVASGQTTFIKQVTVQGNLQTDAGVLSSDDAMANFGAYDPTVEGSVTNNGQIVQVKDVSAVGTVVAFGRIQNAAGTTNKYYGIDITPTAASLGSTTVAIEGNDTCDIPGQGTVTNAVNRCYDITPTNNGQAATIRYYFHNSEQNGQIFSSLNAWHWNSATTAWELLGFSSRMNSANGDSNWNWVEENGITSFSPFLLAESAVVTTPTSIGLNSQIAVQPAAWLLLSLVAALFIVTVRLVSQPVLNKETSSSVDQ